MSDEQRYERYCRWCHLLKMRPAAFEEWSFRTRLISEKWDEVRSENLVKRGSR